MKVSTTRAVLVGALPLLSSACAESVDVGGLPRGPDAGSAGTSDGSVVGGTGGSGGAESGAGAAADASGGTGGGVPEAGGSGGKGGLGGSWPEPECAASCGAAELCDVEHLGLDDDCNGLVDDGCPCVPGRQHACFKGDPARRRASGCREGVARCGEDGTWGACQGGRHATESCFSAASEDCAPPLRSAPYQEIDLRQALGPIANETVGIFELACPSDDLPFCPVLSGTSTPKTKFRPNNLGDYRAKYTTLNDSGVEESCSFEVQVRARGLRVELVWGVEATEQLFNDESSLRLHQPDETSPFDRQAHYCSRLNCGFLGYQANQSPDWFSDSALPPDPVGFYRHPVDADNTCYFGQKYADAQNWSALRKGCPSPRVDHYTPGKCEPADRDTASPMVCSGDAVAVDFPPKDQWFRVGVAFPGAASGLTTPLRPSVRIFCDGRPSALLGPHGYYKPERAVTAAPGHAGFWIAADVLFPSDPCATACIVQPIYADAAARTPLISLETEFGPAYPPKPVGVSH